jgi:FtsP/CotA-like multicopper oxidase with cupredoxin domain
VHRAVPTIVVTVALSTGVLAGCGDDPEGTEPPAAAATETQPGPSSEPAETSPAAEPTQASQPTPAAAVNLQVPIADGEVTPPPDRVNVTRGEQVRIEVTSDQLDELHLHGYDLSANVTPGEPAVLEFTADQTGRFELEAHDAHLQLLQLIVE